MTILITGSTGHLGRALMMHLKERGLPVRGIDTKASAYTDHVGTISDIEFVNQHMEGIDTVLHTATLHKPHVATHSRQDFIDTNVTGTLNLLEAAVRQRVKAFVYTSTTSTFGDAMKPRLGEPAVWVTESLVPRAKNIYGVTKTTAEDLCRLFHRNHGLPCVVLRTSRFFPEEDDSREMRDAYPDANLKANELLFRRADIQDIVDAHLLATEQAAALGFDMFIISATSPFQQRDAIQLGHDAGSVVARYYPDFQAIYSARDWKMLTTIGRVYDNSHARNTLGWQPKYDFRHVLDCLADGRDYRSPLTLRVGSKGYHDTQFVDGPYPV